MRKAVLLHALVAATPAAALLGARLTHCLELAERPFADGTAPQGLVADIGCDHGYLAAEFADRGRTVAAVDVAEAPLDGCRRHFEERGLAPAAFVLGDGVAAVQADASLEWCETAVVAGVGPRTAAAVVEGACCSGASPPPRRFVIQPAQCWIGNSRGLRETLARNGYGVAEEKWLDDNGPNQRPNGRRLLVTIRADRDATAEPSETELLVGLPSADAARVAYVKHHTQWVADVSTQPQDSRKRREAVRWLPLLQNELL
jgi:tRNA A22 N-methylase